MLKLESTSYCGEIRNKDIGAEVVLKGWVHRRRDHGGVIFIDLRDREGIAQVVFNPDHDPDTHKSAHRLRNEFVIGIRGKVRERPEGMINPNLPTGDVEVLVDELIIYNEAAVPPFLIDEYASVTENLRLKYRYLDLRRPEMQKNIMARHKAAMSVRNHLSNEGFIEVETPFLTKSTPEGARDYLVPSRVNPGNFYALPQSPQLFKQILMVAGYDRYFQIVKCFRDEDLRADRQPEFTQIDIEMSFVTVDGIISMTEGLMANLFDDILGIKISSPFPRMTYKEARDKYGTDKPDTRFGLELNDLTDILEDAGLKVFSEAVISGGVIKALMVPESASLTRKELDDTVGFAQDRGAGGLAWARVTENGWQSPIAKFFAPGSIKAVEERTGAKIGSTIFFVADDPDIADAVLSDLRLKMGRRFDLIDDKAFNFLWVVEFPMFEYSKEEKRYVSMHHPFTSPLDEDMDKLDIKANGDPKGVRAKAYDIVLNGNEIGGGSIRISNPNLQRDVFKSLGIGDEEAEEKFGFLMEALSYGAPPHGGIALGFDRLVMLLCGAENIRDVIAFPKTQRATCLMTGAPTGVDKKQLTELGLKLSIAAQKPKQDG
ncbi:MAG: aspartate--tRNA ligase [Deltaproteobacteria bacterium]|uniref:Aspartate--tRNA(Asp/Asn) ligase n=1 Tax=Candidatus Zymogenus saltonus TaxID=2844893 RepID=A0A9D8PPC6_9DELT|nr:aspartate--tRNA ligase [Candidatus Zymogenus saltonus]